MNSLEICVYLSVHVFIVYRICICIYIFMIIQSVYRDLCGLDMYTPPSWAWPLRLRCMGAHQPRREWTLFQAVPELQGAPVLSEIFLGATKVRSRFLCSKTLFGFFQVPVHVVHVSWIHPFKLRARNIVDQGICCKTGPCQRNASKSNW